MKSEAPQLSVVVVIVSDTTESHCDLSPLAWTLESLHKQVDPPTMEIIVPYRSPITGIDELAARFPSVTFKWIADLDDRFHVAGGREHHDELRARGLLETRGEIVALLEDHGCPDPNWARSVCDTHREGWSAVGGAIENGIDTVLNWAVYFCDFFRYQNPVPEGETSFASDANISYKRQALASLWPRLGRVYQETIVNQALAEKGERMGLSGRTVVYQRRQGLHLSNALRERFIWGRSFAASRTRLVGRKRLLLALLSPILPPLIVLRIAKTTLQRRRLAGALLRALPLVALLSMSWALGELVGYLTASPGVRGNQRQEVLAHP